MAVLEYHSLSSEMYGWVTKSSALTEFVNLSLRKGEKLVTD